MKINCHSGMIPKISFPALPVLIYKISPPIPNHVVLWVLLTLHTHAFHVIVHTPKSSHEKQVENLSPWHLDQ